MLKNVLFIAIVWKSYSNSHKSVHMLSRVKILHHITISCILWWLLKLENNLSTFEKESKNCVLPKSVTYGVWTKISVRKVIVTCIIVHSEDVLSIENVYVIFSIMLYFLYKKFSINQCLPKILFHITLHKPPFLIYQT